MTKYGRVNGYANELQLRCSALWQPHKSLAGAGQEQEQPRQAEAGREGERQAEVDGQVERVIHGSSLN